MATVAWNDPANLGQPGWRSSRIRTRSPAMASRKPRSWRSAAPRKAQAIRTGKWALYTELYEGEAVTFSTGLESAFARPGEIIQVMDVNIAGKRRGGRVGAGSTATGSSVSMRRSATLMPAASDVYLSCIIGEGAVETRRVVGPSYRTASAEPLVDPVLGRAGSRHDVCHQRTRRAGADAVAGDLGAPGRSRQIRDQRGAAFSRQVGLCREQHPDHGAGHFRHSAGLAGSHRPGDPRISGADLADLGRRARRAVVDLEGADVHRRIPAAERQLDDDAHRCGGDRPAGDRGAVGIPRHAGVGARRQGAGGATSTTR